uniref:G_PROTEIN_RECEP_F1_2 domain-containing protein n=1 Tax=Macrostomum lignano TaxID=282301 RepID=A0A1I8GB21_9PLAT
KSENQFCTRRFGAQKLGAPRALPSVRLLSNLQSERGGVIGRWWQMYLNIPWMNRNRLLRLRHSHAGTKETFETVRQLRMSMMRYMNLGWILIIAHHLRGRSCTAFAPAGRPAAGGPRVSDRPRAAISQGRGGFRQAEEPTIAASIGAAGLLLPHSIESNEASVLLRLICISPDVFLEKLPTSGAQRIRVSLLETVNRLSPGVRTAGSRSWSRREAEKSRPSSGPRANYEARYGRRYVPDYWLPLQWAALLCKKAMVHGFCDPRSMVMLMEEIEELTADLLSHLRNSSTAVSPVSIGNDNRGEVIDMYFPVFTVFQFLFLMGWLKVAMCVMNPFGDDDEDFHTSEILDYNLEISFRCAEGLRCAFPDGLTEPSMEWIRKSPATSRTTWPSICSPWRTSLLPLPLSQPLRTPPLPPTRPTERFRAAVDNRAAPSRRRVRGISGHGSGNGGSRPMKSSSDPSGSGPGQLRLAAPAALCGGTAARLPRWPGRASSASDTCGSPPEALKPDPARTKMDARPPPSQQLYRTSRSVEKGSRPHQWPGNLLAETEPKVQYSRMTEDSAVPNDSWPLALKLLLSALLSCLTLWTLLGNGLVLLALLSYRQLRSAPNLLIGNLAISDFLLALTVLPLSSVNAVMAEMAEPSEYRKRHFGKTCPKSRAAQIRSCSEGWPETGGPNWLEAVAPMLGIFFSTEGRAKEVAGESVRAGRNSRAHLDLTGGHQSFLQQLLRLKSSSELCESATRMRPAGCWEDAERLEIRSREEAGQVDGAAEMRLARRGGHWQFGPVLCNLWLSLDVLYCTASVWSLVAIAFDRFTATVCPLWYREKQHRCRAVAYSVLVWLLSCLICLPPLIGWDGREFVDPAAKLGRSLVPVRAANSSWDGRVTCDLFKETNYVIYSATGSFILPLLILVVLYARIFHLLRRRARCLRKRRLQQHRQLNQPSGVWFDRELDLATVLPAPTIADNRSATEEAVADDDGEAAAEAGDEPCVLENPTAAAAAAVAPQLEEEAHEAATAAEPLSLNRRGPRRADLREQRATQRMLAIVVVFIVCWMPFTLMYLVRGVTSNESSGGDQPPSAVLEAVQFLAIWLGYANSALNPVLYTVFNQDFRHAIARLLRRRRRRRRRPQNAGS